MVTSRPERLDREELRKAAPAPLNWHKLLLAFGLLLPPITWSLHLTLSYGLTYPAKDAGSKAMLIVVSLASALCSLSGGALGLRELRRGADAEAAPAERERARFLALTACGAGLFFFLATLAQSVPMLMLRLGGRP